MNARANSPCISRGRWCLVAGVCALLGVTLVARAVDLQVLDSEFLKQQAEVRHVRTLPIEAHRGMLLDRNGEPLAISTPVASIWADPGPLRKVPESWPQLADALGVSEARLRRRIEDSGDREFIWLRRHLTPAHAERVLSLQIPGVAERQEFRRYYPMAEVSGHVLGFTSIDDSGLEGLEKAYDRWLEGRPGRKRVVVDRLGRVIGDLELLRPAEPGRDLELSLDRRMQYLAYRELKAAVARHGARGGSLVVLDSHTGEVYAMVNQPAFNPNDRNDRDSQRMRNRAVTDTFEPGSTVKPLTIAAALESGRFTPDTPILTAPGTLKVAEHTIRDYRDLGQLDLTGVLRLSSNVGASRIALSMDDRELWEVYSAVGMGQGTGSGFPGEASGRLPPLRDWSKVGKATMAFGYGISMSPLQLARAYAAIAADGVMPDITFRRIDGTPPGTGGRVMSASTADELRRMLQEVISIDGTGTRAAISGYRVGGKTGTVHKAVAGGYASDRYQAVFAGFAPASDPRLVAVVVIDEPAGEEFYGGQVAAPVFARVMAGALRLLDVRPDDIAVDRVAARDGREGAL